MTPKKPTLLIHAHYYPPDPAATGQLLQELAEGLSDRFAVTVICAVPSYLGTVAAEYRTKPYFHETRGGVSLLRVRVPAFSKDNAGSRIRNLLVYTVRAAAATLRAGDADYVLAVSQPPILGGLLGVWSKRTKHAAFIYNIQDFNPEQLLAVSSGGMRMLAGPLMAIDRFSCRQSGLVITVGRDLAETMHRRFPKRMPDTIVINNWADETAIRPLPHGHPQAEAFRRRYGLEGRFVIMYSGNLGLYYDLENLLRVIADLCDDRAGLKTPDGREVVFAFVGAGAVLEAMKAYAAERGLDNVRFIPYQEKADLIFSLNAGDVHWCVSAKGIRGVSCPSKAYGILAAGRPILGVLEEGSEIRCLIEACGCGLCCAPGDYAGIAKLLRRFTALAGSAELEAMGAAGRAYLEAHLTREQAIQNYAEAIAGLRDGGSGG